MVQQQGLYPQIVEHFRSFFETALAARNVFVAFVHGRYRFPTG
jgi:hypothetical protein